MNNNLFDLTIMDSPREEAARQKRIEEIASRLMKIRKEKGFTQTEMAKKLKTTQSMYSRYETGEIRLYADILLKLAAILGVTPNELYGVTKNGGDAAEPLEHAIPKRIIRKLRGVENLTRTQQDALIFFIEATVNAGNQKKTVQPSA